MDGYCLVVSTINVASVRQCLKELGVSDPSRRLKSLNPSSEENIVAVPIDVDKVKKLLGHNNKNEDNYCSLIHDLLEIHIPGKIKDVQKMHLPCAKKLSVKIPEQLLKENLQKLLAQKGITWCEEIVQDIPTHWEKHGDLILIPTASFTSQIWRELGSEFWDCVTSSLSCKRIARKDVVSTNGYRTPQVCLVYGNSSWVLQTDNGIKYTYDITKCMFSSGNISEKLRVAKFNCKDEIVVDLYAGIGYFTLPYLVHSNVKHLHACEWNPDAVEALQKNLVLNGVQDRCTIHEGNNRQVCPKGIANRVNLGLIPSSKEGWPVACAALNPVNGGILHIHHNVNTKLHPQSVDQSTDLSKLPDDVFRHEAKLYPEGNPRKLENSNAAEDTFNTCTVCQSKGSVNKVDISQYNNTDCDEVQKHETEERKNKHGLSGCCSALAKCESGSERCNILGGIMDVTSVEESADTHNIVHTQQLTDNSILTVQKTPNSLINRLVLNEHQISKMSDKRGEVSNLKPVTNNFIKECEVHKDKHLKQLKWFPWAQEVSVQIKDILEDMYKDEWNTSITHIEHVKSYAPFVDHVVLDLDCRPNFNKPI